MDITQARTAIVAFKKGDEYVVYRESTLGIGHDGAYIVLIGPNPVAVFRNKADMNYFIDSKKIEMPSIRALSAGLPLELCRAVLEKLPQEAVDNTAEK